MKRVLLISTGGTIACTPTDDGLAPTLSAQDIVDRVPDLASICGIEAKTVFSLDSSNIQPEEWRALAVEIHAALDRHDAVVVLHGTDTLAYTSSMLSFMLLDPHKPVILTGSQLPLSEPGSDAADNLRFACRAAVQDLQGVFVVFDRKIIRGTRVSKLRTMSRNAFESINSSLAGFAVGDRIVLDASGPRSRSGPPTLDVRMDPDVLLLKMIPGMRTELFDAALELGYRGIVIEGFGLGGIPSVRRNLVAKIDELCAAGVSVVLSTQCVFEPSDPSVYEVGHKAVRSGIIPGFDMTTETAVTKLMWALGHSSDPDEVRRMMLTDYCGEVTLA